jgi:hypothetical protein
MVGMLDMETVKEKARNFSLEFANKEKEDEYYQDFDDGLLEVFGVSRKKIVGLRYQRSVRIKGKENRGRIDFLWPSVLLIENKSRGENLKKAYEQAERYYNALDDELKPKYIIVTDFENIHLYNGGCKNAITKFKLENLESHVEYLGFITDPNITANIPVSEDAADTLSLFYERLRDAKNDEEKLTKYLMRLVFCMFAEDTGIFGKKGDNVFSDFIKKETREDGSDLGSRLHWLFEWLNTPNEKREGKQNIDKKYHAFPYVNGGLFDVPSDLPGSIDFDEETREILISCALADWKNVSPSIFGTLFQERMDKYERRQLGAHYTSEKCIHRVIDPLFLNDLNEKFSKIGNDLNKLDAFHEEIASLKILDPACGCGSFLVVAYSSLRDLEIKVLKKKLEISLKGKKIGVVKNQVSLNDLRDRRISIQQFHGIETLPFPAEIAKTAMILIDHKKNMEVSDWVGITYMRIPLERYENIKCDDALEAEWEQSCDYIIGNPPFVDRKNSNEKQKLQKKRRKINWNCDYVCCWFHDASASYLDKFPNAKCAFVATSSICQGIHAEKFMIPFLENIWISFAYSPFEWDGIAAATVIIIGFQKQKPSRCYLYSSKTDFPEKGTYLNAFLELGGKKVEHKSINKKRYPEMRFGIRPLDGGYHNHQYFMTESEYHEYITKYGINHIKKIINGDDLINDTYHYILDLCDVPDTELSPEESRRVQNVKQIRDNSGKIVAAECKKRSPKKYYRDNRPTHDYLAIVQTFSISHDRIPMKDMNKDILCTCKCLFINNPSEKLRSILQSSEFYDYVKKRARRTGDVAISFVPGIYYSYLDMIGYTEEGDSDDFL